MENSTNLEASDESQPLSANIDPADIKDTTQDETLKPSLDANNLVEFPSPKNESKETQQYELDENVTRVPSKAEIEAAVFAEMGTKDNNDVVIDNLREDDAMRYQTSRTERYIERYAPEEDEERETENLGFWMIMLTGFILLGASLAASLRGAERLFGVWGPLLILSGLIIGAVMVLGAAYYALRRAFR